MNPAAVLREFQRRKQAGSSDPTPAPRVGDLLPPHPPIRPCGCDGSGWRPITALRGHVEVVRCQCWLAKHPRPPKPAPKRARKQAAAAVPIVGRDRQFRDD